MVEEVQYGWGEVGGEGERRGRGGRRSRSRPPAERRTALSPSLRPEAYLGWSREEGEGEVGGGAEARALLRVLRPPSVG